MKSKKTIITALILIAAAILMILNGVGVAFGSGIELWRIALGAALLAWLVWVISDKKYYEVFLPLALMFMVFERNIALLFDAKTGRPLNNNLLDYKLSTFMDHPNLQAEFVENYEPTSAFGTKALGEPPACSPAPAIRNAIKQATGVGIDRCPITPHVLFAEFTKTGLIQD